MWITQLNKFDGTKLMYFPITIKLIVVLSAHTTHSLLKFDYLLSFLIEKKPTFIVLATKRPIKGNTHWLVSKHLLSFWIDNLKFHNEYRFELFWRCKVKHFILYHQMFFWLFSKKVHFLCFWPKLAPILYIIYLWLIYPGIDMLKLC